ncbi:hypothetical protein CKO15_10720 [Halorhodospira abdelmalekii]|uniref:regulatory protein RecX n=1 Tax=Halorhodospira abdelmalekii TaxID=421629 RepID=UPI001902C96B|nr:regulatory protein RecX [Halorhodospira abdelmalekii]MBK1735742.1 hypothetical protein [Halorhodospira abdelmalekii]
MSEASSSQQAEPPLGAAHDAARYEQAKGVALRLLARREHAPCELVHKLTQRGYAESLCAELIDELIAQGWLSAARFAEVFVRSRCERGQGPVRLRYELQQRGVEAALIDQTIAAHPVAWEQLARQVRERRFGASLPQQRREQQRQGQFLQRRGFTAEQIRAALSGTDDADQ